MTTFEGGYHPLNNENFMIFCKGDFHPSMRPGYESNRPLNGGLQHHPLITHFSAFHPFGGQLSSFSAPIVFGHRRPVKCAKHVYGGSLLVHIAYHQQSHIIARTSLCARSQLLPPHIASSPPSHPQRFLVHTQILPSPRDQIP